MGRTSYTHAEVRATVDRVVAVARDFDATVLVVPSRGLWLKASSTTERALHEEVVDALRAHGLTVGSELVKVVNGKRGDVRLRVTDVGGLGRATAELMAGKLDQVKSGDAFVLDKYVPDDQPALRVFVPPALPTPKALEVRRKLEEVKAKVGWVEDPTVTAPTHVLAWSGKAWTLTRPDGSVDALGEAADGGRGVRNGSRMRRGGSSGAHAPAGHPGRHGRRARARRR